MTAAGREAERAQARNPEIAKESPSPLRHKEPSPPGRGQGEGASRAFDGADIASARRPHPDPLPQGEGMAGGPHGRKRRGNFPTHLLHSTCISRPSRWLDRWAA
jgi:hypothetical protein